MANNLVIAEKPSVARRSLKSLDVTTSRMATSPEVAIL